MSAVNPYAPPRAAVADISPASSEAEAIRREHVTHEASVRSVGLLYYLSGGLLLLVSLALLFPSARRSLPSGAMLGAVYIALAVLSLVIGRGLRQLKPWARIGAAILAGLGLLGFPIGTIINAYILYLLLSKKGKRIFEPDYPQIIADTPHIKARTSVVTWFVLGVLMLVLLGIGVMAALKT